TEVVPEGTTITIAMQASEISQNNVISFTAMTDANGFFEITVPATPNGTNYDLTFPTLVLDQTIAKNKDEGQDDFPTTLPSVVTISTTFDPNVTSAVGIPSVPPIYGTVPAPASGNQGVISQSITVNTSGEITGMFAGILGSGYTTTDETITIVSLSGGTGATATVAVSGGSLSTVTVTNGGSGYPTFSSANRLTFGQNPTVDNFSDIQLRSGEIRILDSTYGTGTSRAVSIE
ncbi:MAG: hypothetical protein AAGA66_14090, partial [Bacteroidota bacterium]